MISHVVDSRRITFFPLFFSSSVVSTVQTWRKGGETGDSAGMALAVKPPSGTGRSVISTTKVAVALIVFDAVLVSLIIAFVPYTKIDWDAYMSQVEGFLGGEKDYTKLRGDTGPLVYPAGFLYVYSAIRFLTDGEVYPAQILFGIIYITNLAVILIIYVKTNVLPWWALCLLSLSKRIHSIFMLRLFNDCFAMTLLHAAVLSVLYQKWHLALIVFSGAVSIKMNVLLYAPSLFILMLKGMPIKRVITALLGAAFIQILVGFPFLLSYPVGYISRSFNLGRVFIHFWSVNFKFVPEEVFVSKKFASGLLIIHLLLLMVFAHYKWCKHEGGLPCFVRSNFSQWKNDDTCPRYLDNVGCTSLNKDHIVTVLFVGNFIGILCARSLHYQFYSWYFYSLPFLLWKCPFPTILRLLLFCGVELCWNIYPSNFYSSILLLCIHLCILWGLWISPSEHPYTKKPHVVKKE